MPGMRCRIYIDNLYGKIENHRNIFLSIGPVGLKKMKKIAIPPCLFEIASYNIIRTLPLSGGVSYF
jgi:hypothetical protein